MIIILTYLSSELSIKLTKTHEIKRKSQPTAIRKHWDYLKFIENSKKFQLKEGDDYYHCDDGRDSQAMLQKIWRSSSINLQPAEKTNKTKHKIE